MGINMDSKKPKFFKKDWISLAVLKRPQRHNGQLSRGALIVNQVDKVLEMYPSLKHFFFVIERHGWFGLNEATQADIMLVEDSSVFEILKKMVPDSILLDISDGDFVDITRFKPIDIEMEIDVLQLGCWSRRKRIELFIEAAAKLPDLKFVQIGHFENNGTEDELLYQKQCIELAKEIAPNVSFPYSDRIRYQDLPHKKCQINTLINKSAIGVITTTPEGINRFKMECFSANKVCLVAADAGTATQKHLNRDTGSLFQPNADDLADKIVSTLDNLNSFSPREYILKSTGINNSMHKLKEALRTLCDRHKQPFIFDDISYNGRNESLKWGDAAIGLLQSLSDRPYS